MKEIWSRPGVREAKRKTMIEYRQASKYRKSMSAAVKKSWDKSPPKRRQEAAKVYRNIGQFVLNAPPIQIMVGKKVPDILHVEKPVAIELFGDYWHSEGRTGLSRQGAEKERKDHFKKYGFRTVVIWESEMYEDTVRNKVRRVLK
jgi:predicted glycosyl hydrolase (DUF1957 family)